MNEVKSKYKRVTNAQRAEVLRYKGEGYKNKRISIIMQINIKTVASIKFSDRKSDFRDIKQILFEQLKESQNIEPIPLNQVTRRIRSMINNPQGDLNRAIEEYNKLNKKKKFNSKNRKIIQQVANEFIDSQNYQSSDQHLDSPNNDVFSAQKQDHQIEDSPVYVDQYLQQEEFPLYDIFGEPIIVKNENSFNV